jgi:hypothetical protein
MDPFSHLKLLPIRSIQIKIQCNVDENTENACGKALVCEDEVIATV